ncbi:hypothetical protein PC129_g10386 [Phytophthora cactorum]|uniref:Uncharacterized protein n=1 Tax=Phytophthora cactorum TaxID=29920 RepID=A0A8T1I372_9STRA|nr:hypothetical protein PC129_g10386 [Phytophthora cactorum]
MERGGGSITGANTGVGALWRCNHGYFLCSSRSGEEEGYQPFSCPCKSRCVACTLFQLASSDGYRETAAAMGVSKCHDLQKSGS